MYFQSIKRPIKIAIGVFFSVLAMLAFMTSHSMDSPLNIKDYGAIGDGQTDDTKAIQSVIDRLKNEGGGEIFIPEGIYVAGGLVLYSNMTLTGSGSLSILKTRTGDKEEARAKYLISVNPYDGGSPDIKDNAKNIVIRNLQLRGTVEKDGFFEHKHLLNLNAVTNVIVENVSFVGFRGDGIYLGSGNKANIERHNKNIMIRGCLFDGVNNDNRNGVSIIDGEQITVEESRFIRVSNKRMPGAIDVEPNDDFSFAQNLKFTKNIFENCGDGGFAILYYTRALSLKHKPSKIHVANNLIGENCSPRVAAIAIVTGQKPEDLSLMDVNIEKNTILSKAPTVPILLSNVQGILIRENLIKNGSAINFGSYGGHTTGISNLIFENNIVSHTGSSVAMISINNGKNLSFINNIFEEPNKKSKYFIAFENNQISETDAKISIMNNFFIRGLNENIKITNLNDQNNERYDGNQSK